MSLSSRAAHGLIQVFQGTAYRQFLRGLSNLESVQRDKLGKTLKYLQPFHSRPMVDVNYETFCQQFPVTTYADYHQKFSDERNHTRKTLPQVVRFQPTSGSTDKVKWIPYTAQLLKDFDAALGPWLFDFYSQNPSLLKGVHYWSLSWLPKNMRNEGMRLDDTELFPWWKKLLLKKTMAVVEPVDLADSIEASLFATLVFLVEQENLTFASVWSPTYFLTLLDFLETHQKSISQSLIDGKWHLYGSELSKVRCPKNEARGRIVQESVRSEVIWPQFKILSCWTTSTSAVLSEDIQRRCPQLQLSGKGLWATEAVITIPFQNEYVLASQSHFFEFLDIDSQKIIPSWELTKGQKVSPIVTTTGGLLRYRLEDVLEVTGFQQKTPILNFIGRTDGVDMVGEKISSLFAQEVLQDLLAKNPQHEAYLLAVKDHENLYYCAVLQTKAADVTCLASELENLLQNSFHYRLARELRQLKPARVVVYDNTRERYLQLHLKRGMVLGNIKMEPLKLISGTEFQENFL